MRSTTDVILGGVDGTSSIQNNDFNRRGEYEGGPDGCAIECAYSLCSNYRLQSMVMAPVTTYRCARSFETSSSGVRVDGNTIYKSWGAGIMVKPHLHTTSVCVCVRTGALQELYHRMEPCIRKTGLRVCVRVCVRACARTHTVVL